MSGKKQSKSDEKVRNGHIASNKRARHDYELIDKFEAGLALQGSEVKTLRQGRATITDGYISVDSNHEVWVENLSIPPYNHAANTKFVNHTERRKRKLLLHALEIKQIEKAIATKGMTAVALALYFHHGRAKLEIALARGKKLHDKRETIKERDISRETAREFKLR
jgi:SsrA-binding protein